MGLSHLCPKKFSTAPEKTTMLTCKIILPDSPHPVIISKNPGFRALYVTRHNEFRFFRLINTKNTLAAGFCSKNLAFARKITVLPESEGLQPLSPLARTPMFTWCKFKSCPDDYYLLFVLNTVPQNANLRGTRRFFRQPRMTRPQQVWTARQEEEQVTRAYSHWPAAYRRRLSPELWHTHKSARQSTSSQGFLSAGSSGL